MYSVYFFMPNLSTFAVHPIGLIIKICWPDF